jgi:hypothetical protein
MKKILVLLLLLTSTNVLAEWTLTLYPPNNPQLISDDVIGFKLSDMFCGVSKTQFSRNPDDGIMEYRVLYCKSPEGITFSNNLTCRLPFYEIRQLIIDKGTSHFSPMLMCGPSKQ